MLARIFSLVIGYALGQVLTADIVSRRVAGKPAFELGVGNPGMANIGHELGRKWAYVVLAGDIGKTLLAVIIARLGFHAEPWALTTAWAALGATLGHNFPAWHHFHGGKGVTTTCAGIILTAPGIGIAASLLGAAGIVVCGYLCAGAIIITLAYLVFALLLGNIDVTVTALALLVLMCLAHGPAAAGIRTGDTPVAGLSNKVLVKVPALQKPCLTVRRLFGGPASNQYVHAKSGRSSSSAKSVGHGRR